ncbi:uncharacterized protein F4807DRAFT_464574 [Annulohypoxylon truncatum]|uniref:uncharacterized protein n=1 Tax=Annulohypoxylon truncatum TaxID=327061 RepID=UPI0020083E4E|nr:uncharacterized protein F4807DRAFT_464574 [Annulohypoxylon truncatum]KAI1205487.1 hypothetical protein F4807DRAFT_464574 [Annulohypoxylon truncatum]
MSKQIQYYQKPVHVVGTCIFLSVVDIIVVGLRFKVRKLQKLPVGPDDWIIIPALLMTVLMAVDIVYGVFQKALACQTEVPPGSTTDLTFDIITNQILLSFKIGYMFNIAFVLAIGLIKASVLLFYLRIFSIMKSKVRAVLITLITIVAMWVIAWLFESIFNCKLNFWAVWGTSQDLKTKCVNFFGADLALCVTDFIIDIVIIAFPIPLIWHLNVSTRRKVATSGIFLLGIATIITSLIRVIMSARIVAIGLATDSDQVLTITVYLYWGMVECGIGVVVACLPTLAFLFKDFTWRSIRVTMRRPFTRTPQSSTSLDHDSIYVQGLTHDIYKRATSSSNGSNSSSRPRLSNIGDDPIHDPEFYSMKDIIRARESV